MKAGAKLMNPQIELQELLAKQTYLHAVKYKREDTPIKK